MIKNRISRTLRSSRSGFFQMITGLALLAGCSSTSDDPTNTTATATDAGASTDSASGTGQAGDTDGAGGDVSCASLTTEAQNQLASAFASANADLSCTTDSDCVLADIDSDCTSSCGAVYTTAGAATVAAAIAQVNMSTCAPFVQEGCLLDHPPCTAQPPAAVCVQSKCTYGYPATWTSLGIEADTGGTGTSVPVACSGSACITWTVTPDAKIVKTSAAGTANAALSSADFATVDGILRSAAFRQSQGGAGPACLTATTASNPSEEHVTLDNVRPPGGATGVEISGCVDGDAGANDYVTLYNVLKAY